jgi:hypothetical protein
MHLRGKIKTGSAIRPPTAISAYQCVVEGKAGSVALTDKYGRITPCFFGSDDTNQSTR